MSSSIKASNVDDSFINHRIDSETADGWIIVCVFSPSVQQGELLVSIECEIWQLAEHIFYWTTACTQWVRYRFVRIVWHCEISLSSIANVAMHHLSRRIIFRNRSIAQTHHRNTRHTQTLGRTQRNEIGVICYAYPRAISKLLMSFLIFQISTLRSADVSSFDILIYWFLLNCCAEKWPIKCVTIYCFAVADHSAGWFGSRWMLDTSRETREKNEIVRKTVCTMYSVICGRAKVVNSDIRPWRSHSSSLHRMSQGVSSHRNEISDVDYV